MVGMNQIQQSNQIPQQQQKSVSVLPKRKTLTWTIVSIVFICLIGLAIYLPISGNFFSVTNTSTIIPPAKNLPPEPEKSISLLFLGDMMLDRGVRAQISKIGYGPVFVDATKTLSADYDFTIANLEGPITDYPSKTIGPDGRGIEGFAFTFPSSSAKAIKESGIDIVSLANNHIDNFGPEGMQQTKKYLDAAEVGYFGNPTNSGDGENPITPLSNTFCKNDICIALIGYHEFTYQNEEQILTAIDQAKQNKADFIIVMPHWGVEYAHKPNSRQIALAHGWIDAGADMIIGAHPHVIQSKEKYKGKMIFYSLGNYLFDQYFSYHTTHGLAVGFEISNKITPETATSDIENASFKNSTGTNPFSIKNIKLIPITNKNIITKQSNATDTKIMLDKLEEISE